MADTTNHDTAPELESIERLRKLWADRFIDGTGIEGIEDALEGRRAAIGAALTTEDMGQLLLALTFSVDQLSEQVVELKAEVARLRGG